MSERSQLVRIKVTNIGCIGPEGLEICLDSILCLVGPNNSGKSTILRAYELAVGKLDFTEQDLCNRAGDQPAAVEIWVHIPQGTPNIAEEWKSREGLLLLVRSKWEWSRDSKDKTKFKKSRVTWDPSVQDWAEGKKASGLDEVFESRLPVPLRIGTLQDPEDEHKQLLALVLQPIVEEFKALQEDRSSELRRALDAIESAAKEPVDKYQQRLQELGENVKRAHSQVFPHVTVDFDVRLGTVDLDIKKQLQNNSGIRFTEGSGEVRWSQQGTGSQRALFWTLLQVRSRLKTLADIEAETQKDLDGLEKKKLRLSKELQGSKKEETKEAKKREIEECEQEMERLRCLEPETRLESRSAELKLPGYMLLLDEPEVGLHPGAIRAASRHLYSLAEDPAWQVMISTHAPAFVDPLQDHTTIVRLERTQQNPTPKTYRCAKVMFSPDERDSLKMLNSFDAGVAEMFFGGYPILVEGDTEYAAFEEVMENDPRAFPLVSRPIIVRARGKWTLTLLIRMLSHFQVSFSVLHDSDVPFTSLGRSNPAWSANTAIGQEIEAARGGGVRVVHRVSIPTIELAHAKPEVDECGRLLMPSPKDKPWQFLQRLKTDPDVHARVRKLLTELRAADAVEMPFPEGFAEGLPRAVRAWAEEFAPEDRRFAPRASA